MGEGFAVSASSRIHNGFQVHSSVPHPCKYTKQFVKRKEKQQVVEADLTRIMGVFPSKFAMHTFSLILSQT